MIDTIFTSEIYTVDAIGTVLRSDAEKLLSIAEWISIIDGYHWRLDMLRQVLYIKAIDPAELAEILEAFELGYSVRFSGPFFYDQYISRSAISAPIVVYMEVPDGK